MHKKIALLALALAVAGCEKSQPEAARSEAVAPNSSSPIAPSNPTSQPLSQIHDGPFGLSMGMSANEVMRDTGGQLQAGETMIYTTKTPPKKVGGVETVVMIVSARAGLCKVAGIGATINNADAYGTALGGEFRRIKEALVERYGRPGLDSDTLLPGSIWSEPKEWMMGLYKQERILTSIWIDGKGVTLPSNLHAISLEAKAASTSAGWVTLGYEFKNFPECQAELKAAANAGV